MNLYDNSARLYDLDPREIVKKDIDFFLNRASEKKGRILELACGTGRITIPLALAGHEVWGIDLSQTMLSQFNSKVKNLPEHIKNKIHVTHGDMTDFKFDVLFDMIIIPFRSFQCLTEQTLQNNCLRSVYNSLKDDGTFILTLLRPMENIDNEWVKSEEIFDWENTDPESGFEVKRSLLRRAIDVKNQIIYADYNYYIKDNDGSTKKIVDKGCMKYYYEKQIIGLLRSIGFKITEKYHSYGFDTGDEGTEIICICEKNL